MKVNHIFGYNYSLENMYFSYVNSTVFRDTKKKKLFCFHTKSSKHADGKFSVQQTTHQNVNTKTEPMCLKQLTPNVTILIL